MNIPRALRWWSDHPHPTHPLTLDSRMSISLLLLLCSPWDNGLAFYHLRVALERPFPPAVGILGIACCCWSLAVCVRCAALITDWVLVASQDEQWSEVQFLVPPDGLCWLTSAPTSEITCPVYLTGGILIVLWVSVCDTPCHVCFCLFLTILWDLTQAPLPLTSPLDLLNQVSSLSLNNLQERNKVTVSQPLPQLSE